MGKAAIIAVCSVFLVAMVVAVAVGVTHYRKNGNGSGGSDISTSTKAVKSICAPTDYKETCEKSLSSANTTDPKELVKLAFQAAWKEVEQSIANSETMKELLQNDMDKQALGICNETLNFCIEDLKRSFTELGEFDIHKIGEYMNQIKVWLGGSLTYQQTCLDAFTSGTPASEKMKALLKTSQEMTSNGLAMVDQVADILKNLDITGISDSISTSGSERRLLEDASEPSWISPEQRHLLQQGPGAPPTPNFVVDQKANPSGNVVRTIADALAKIPKSQQHNNSARFIIHIKTGVYNEPVNIERYMRNVMFLGDGPDKTRITGHKNFVDKVQTYHTATVAVNGDNFVAKDIAFENSAGPEKHQAVALRVSGDSCVFYNCHIDGSQDTLYAHNYRQYYRDCTISGTIDFIFGNALALFQNCKIIVRKPGPNQQCIVTAQGREVSHEISATVLHNCTISGAPEYIPVKNTNKAYLGRPWKQFSRTLIVQSQIDDIIDPEGFLKWNDTFAFDTLWYAEFKNRGPGAVTTNRVKWPGIKTIDEGTAAKFMADEFLRAYEWIPETAVPYTPKLIPGL